MSANRPWRMKKITENAKLSKLIGMATKPAIRSRHDVSYQMPNDKKLN